MRPYLARARPGRFAGAGRLVALLPLTAFLFAFLVWPLALLAWRSVGPGIEAGSGGWTWANYAEILHDPLYREALVHSLVLSAAVAAGATLLCLGPAWLFAFYRFPGKRLMRALFTLPMTLSGIIVGFLAVILLGRVGFIPQTLERLTGRAFLAGSAYQLSGLVVAYLYFEIPRGLLTLEAALRRFDPQLDAAARSLGARPAQRFFWVVVPLIWPALVASLATTFSASLGSFGVALIVSKRFSVLPLELFGQFTAILNAPLASAMACALAGIALAVNLLARRAAERV